MEQKFKIGDNVIITSWHHAKIKLPQRGVIEEINKMFPDTPFKIMIEKDQYDKKDTWWFKENEFILSHFDGDIPEVGTECNVIAGRVEDGFWRSYNGTFEMLNEGWDNFNIVKYEVINNKLYAITRTGSGVLASELTVVNKMSESKQLNKTTMNEFYVSGSDSLRIAFVKECEANSIGATGGLTSDIAIGCLSDSSVIGGSYDYSKILSYTDAYDKTEFKLPAQYNEALEYAKAFFNQKEEVKEEDPLEELEMDSYNIEFEDGMVKFGCKEFKPSQVNKILSVMKYLENISDGGDRAVALTRDKLEVNGDTLDIGTLQKIYNRIK